jgi:hypothetical protein
VAIETMTTAIDEIVVLADSIAHTKVLCCNYGIYGNEVCEFKGLKLAHRKGASGTMFIRQLKGASPSRGPSRSWVYSRVKDYEYY